MMVSSFLFLSTVCFFCSRKDLNPLYVICAGGIAGVLDWGYSIVPDTLKSRIQTGLTLVSILSPDCYVYFPTVPNGQYKGIAHVYHTLVS